MNIALFASAYFPSLGGVEEVVRQLAHEYRRRGFSPFVVTNRWPRSLSAREDVEGIPVYRFAMRVPEGNAKARLNYQLTHRRIEQEMIALLREHRTELLHVHCIGFNTHYALLARRALKVPLVLTAHGELTMDVNDIYNTSKFMKQVIHQAVREADYITACSRKTLEDLEKHVGGFPSPHHRSVLNGIHQDEFATSRPFEYSKPYILAMGRMVPQKGFDVLLRAFAQGLQRNDMAGHDLLLAGAGDERAALEALAKELRLGDRIQFLGRADHAMAVSLFKGCSFFAMPSKGDEGLPMVSIEAMAAGKATLGTQVGGVAESVVEGETGFLVPRNDVAAFTEKLVLLTGDAALRDRLGNAAKARAPLFEWSTITDQYLDVYRLAMKTA